MDGAWELRGGALEGEADGIGGVDWGNGLVVMVL